MRAVKGEANKITLDFIHNSLLQECCFTVRGGEMNIRCLAINLNFYIFINIYLYIIPINIYKYIKLYININFKR